MLDDWRLFLKLIPPELMATFYMVGAATAAALACGIPLGVLLVVLAPGHLCSRPALQKILGFLVNVGRSVPFAILMVALLPITRWLVGSSIGTTASIVPLTIAAIPFVARVVEGALKEVDGHLIEASQALGATPWQSITTVLLPEALPALIHGVTLTVVNVIGYSAMAGLVGGGGLGKVAIQYGYQRFNLFIMLGTVAVLVLLVQAVQWTGGRLAEGIVKHRKQGSSS